MYFLGLLPINPNTSQINHTHVYILHGKLLMYTCVYTLQYDEMLKLSQEENSTDVFSLAL